MNVVTMRPNAAFKQGPIDLLKTNFSDKKDLIALQIGSYAGQSTQLFLSTGKIKQIYCIDPWQNGYDATDYASNTNDKAQAFFDNRFKTQLRVHKVKGYSYDKLKDFSDSYFDFIYIDGNHQEQAVKQDIQLCLPKLKQDGVLAGHDYDCSGFPGVVRAVNSALHRCPQFTFSDFSWSCTKASLASAEDKCMFCIITQQFVKEYSVMLQSFLKYNKDWDIVLFYPGLINVPGVTKQIDITQDLKKYPQVYTLRDKIWSYRAQATYRCLQEYKTVLYCDSDFYFYNSVEEPVRTIFTLHNNYPTDTWWFNICSRDGFINTGFYIAKNDKETQDWFSFARDKFIDGTATNAIYGGSKNTVWDQKLYFTLPFVAPKVYNILKNDGYNVAWWNLNQRNIHLVDSKLYSNQDPLVCFHFSAKKSLFRDYKKFDPVVQRLISSYFMEVNR